MERYLMIMVIFMGMIYPQCNDYNQSECSDDASCNWVDNIEFGNCSEFDQNSSACEEMLLNCGELCGFIIGDLNDDEILDILDIIITINLIMNNEYLDYADMNEDSIINILDIIQMINIILY